MQIRESEYIIHLSCQILTIALSSGIFCVGVNTKKINYSGKGLRFI